MIKYFLQVPKPEQQNASSATSEDTKKEESPQKAVSPPKKKSKNDFKFMKILGEGSYSTVSS